MPAQLYVGLMSGTSVDSIDAALISIDGDQFKLVATHTSRYESDLRESLLTLKAKPTVDLAAFVALDHRVGCAFANATLDLLSRSNTSPENVAAIGSHGQTLFHLPENQYPGTLQIGDPNIIAHRTSIDVIADFRRADMAVGGQGAPLAPAFHQYMLGKDSGKVVVNLGGIANITVLANPVIGFDTGPANSILDALAQKHLATPFDQQGQWARSGNVDCALLKTMLADPYFSKPAPKSTGTDYFNLDWALRHRRTSELSGQDLQATLVELTATTVADSIRELVPENTEVFVCGGGARNDFLMERLDAMLPSAQVKLLDEAGVSGDACEASTFAWLAHRYLTRRSGNLPSVTGAGKAVILGGLFPAESRA